MFFGINNRTLLTRNKRNMKNILIVQLSDENKLQAVFDKSKWPDRMDIWGTLLADIAISITKIDTNETAANKLDDLSKNFNKYISKQKKR